MPRDPLTPLTPAYSADQLNRVLRLLDSRFDAFGIPGPARILDATTAASGGIASAAYLFGTGAFGVYWGASAPTVSALRGSLYLRTDGSGSTNRIYVNTDSATNWTALLSAS